MTILVLLDLSSSLSTLIDFKVKLMLYLCQVFENLLHLLQKLAGHCLLVRLVIVTELRKGSFGGLAINLCVFNYST